MALTTTSRTDTRRRAGAEVDRPRFADPEGLRALLLRMHDSGSGAWRDDAEVAELMRFAMDKYAMLADKHHRPAADAATAAWEAMRNECTLVAEDPWGVITTAVQRSLFAEQRAEGLLCSAGRVTQPEFAAFHDATRFGECEEDDPAGSYPALRVTGDPDIDDPGWPLDGTDADRLGASPDRDRAAGRPVGTAIGDVARFLILHDWDAEVVRAGLVYICTRLMDEGDRPRAYEALRRDRAACAHLDLSRKAWTGLLRLVLGTPGSPSLTARHGLLVRLLIGERFEDLLADDKAVRAAEALADPRWTNSPGDLAVAILDTDERTSDR